MLFRSIESGSSDVTVDVPFEEYDRLKAKDGLAGVVSPVSDIGMIFLNNDGPMLDKNVRMAAAISIDKKAIVDKLLHGYATPISTRPPNSTRNTGSSRSSPCASGQLATRIPPSPPTKLRLPSS